MKSSPSSLIEAVLYLSKATHTPGPWQIFKHDSQADIAIEHQPKKAGAASIGVCNLDYWNCRRKPGMAMANARLIAAAPEILKVVIQFSNAITEKEMGEGCNWESGTKVPGRSLQPLGDGDGRSWFSLRRDTTPSRRQRGVCRRFGMEGEKPKGFGEFDDLMKKIINVKPSQLPAITTEICDKCEGVGLVDGATCPKCDGTGLVKKE